MEKNNLDNLFKDKLGSFSEVPDEGVWKKIETSLDKKKKKRVIPIWWQLGGVAALLAVLFYVINPFDSTEQKGSTITDAQKNNPIEHIDENGQNTDPSILKGKKPVETTEVTTNTNEKNQTSLDQNDQEATSKTNASNVITNANNTKISSLANVGATKKPNTIEKEKLNQDVNAIMSKDNQSENAVAETNDKGEKILNDKAPIKNQDILKDTSKDAVAETPIDKVEEEKTKSIFDAINEQNQEEKEALVENRKSKWSVGPSVAPVFFDAVGEGSPIHSNFAANSKSGNVNLSYGLQVSYDISKKLSVRTGIHRVDFGYDTNEVVFSSSLQSSTNALIDNIDYSQASRNLVVESSKSRTTSTFSDNANVNEFAASSSPGLEGRMVQEMGYLEVPFELNYALIDKKLGVNIIGGVSSLFLIDNTVSLESNNLITEMGEANNVNDVNFSTNIGLGFNYEFTPKVQLNLEPIFKYQLNTFSETSGRFRPYTLGVYSGISFKF